MSDKASGNETEGRRDDDRELELPNTPEGEELTIDREAGDQLDRSDRWWDNSDSYQREGKGNRKVTPNKRAAAEAEKAETKLKYLQTGGVQYQWSFGSQFEERSSSLSRWFLESVSCPNLLCGCCFASIACEGRRRGQQ